MDLTIEQSCPSCGAPITLHETDRLLTCPYCDVGNYLITKAGSARFVLPDKAPESIDRENMMYVPYLRFKGTVFSCRGREVEYKVVDTTHQGMNVHTVPVSLGLRPQAMHVFPVTQSVVGLFLRQQEKPSIIFSKACNLASLFDKDASESTYHRAFIGETISCIYLPVYLRDGDLYDAVLNRTLGSAASVAEVIKSTVRYKSSWSPRFLATICPRCAGRLEGETDGLVLSCSNCKTLWSEHEGKFKQVHGRVVVSGRGEDEGLYLPFWRIRPGIEGVRLESLGDFLRQTNQPIAVTRMHDQHDFWFWIPAFKIRPKYFLQMAKSITVSQDRIPEGEENLTRGMYPVTLPKTEAFQSLKTVLSHVALNKRNFLPRLPAITFSPGQTQLVYLPFAYAGHDLVQEQTSVCVASNVLQFGRNL